MPETMHEGSYVPTKRYEDGKTGSYYCLCCICGGRFIGDKRDVICPRPHPKSEPAAE